MFIWPEHSKDTSNKLSILSYTDLTQNWLSYDPLSLFTQHRVLKAWVRMMLLADVCLQNFSCSWFKVQHYQYYFVYMRTFWGLNMSSAFSSSICTHPIMTAVSLFCFLYFHYPAKGFPDGSAGKESTCNAGDPGLIPGSGRSPREGIGYPVQYSWVSLVAQLVKNPPAMWETWVWSLGWEDPLEKGKVTHSSILAWRIPWTV